MNFNDHPFLLPRRTVVELLDLPRGKVEGLRSHGDLRVWRVAENGKWRYLRCDLAPVLGRKMEWGRLLECPELVTRSVFQELLGLSDEEIDEGREAGVIRAWRGRAGNYHRYYRGQMLELAGYQR